MNATETGIVIPIPSWDGFVRRWRPIVDAEPPVGIPAHITLLYPFVPPDAVAIEIPKLEQVARTTAPFDFELREVGWFDDEVVYVSVEPEAVFSRLTSRLVEVWPDCLPYGGAHEPPTPHLTIGVGGARSRMRRVADAASSRLPDRCRAEELAVMVGRPSPPVWTQTRVIRLGG